VRELKNYIQRACILADEVIDFPPSVGVADAYTTDSRHLAIRVGITLAEVDRQLIMATLSLCSGAKKRAAQLLGISLKTLYNRLEEYSQIQQSQILAETCALPRRYPSFISGEKHV
jgi:DNA-binding NtrC family response regulator